MTVVMFLQRAYPSEDKYGFMCPRFEPRRRDFEYYGVLFLIPDAVVRYVKIVLIRHIDPPISYPSILAYTAMLRSAEIK